MRQTEILQALGDRARHALAQTRLTVDYYRIRRRVAFPWPLTSIPPVELDVAIPNYPWPTWFALAVEERINSLGWAGHLLEDDQYRARCDQDLASVARWPAHSRTASPSLELGHLLRTLSNATRNWNWISAGTRQLVAEACERAVDQWAGWIEANAVPASVEAILAMGSPGRERATHNIPMIGTIGLALAAEQVNHRSASLLHQRVETLALARLRLLEMGTTEGVAYDGYVLDFVADWLERLLGERRRAFLQSAGLQQILRMSIDLGAPGDVLNVAPLSDVEPREWTFHASAHVKLAALTDLPESRWYLGHCRLDWLRSEAIARMTQLPEQSGAAFESSPGVRTGPYAVTLRSGWGSDDTALVIGASRSPMGHIHRDSGSILLGRKGVWWIDDPGYQQYLKTSEREFTMGTFAHNAPVINGHAHVVSAASLDSQPAKPGEIGQVTVDMTACYPPELQLTRAARSAWLLPDAVVLCDVVAAAGPIELRYAWHGLPAAGWWVEDGKALLEHDTAELWLQTNHDVIRPACVTRLRGSRGHLSLMLTLPSAAKTMTCWWVFNFGSQPTRFAADERELSVKNFRLRAPGPA